MAQKAEIQYISQFCDYGSDKTPHKKKKKKFVWKKKPAKVHVITLDPVALLGIASAVILCVAMVFGGFHLNRIWKEHVHLTKYLSHLQEESARLERQALATFNLDEIKTMADSIGLQPETDMETRYIRLTPPEPKEKDTFLDDIKWFLRGLFAKDYPPGCIIDPQPK